MESNNFKLEILKSKLSHLKRKAWKPIVQEGDGAIAASKYAGKPWLNEDEEYPTCPNCSKSMQLFLQLNLDELPQNLKSRFGSGILQFFYCTNVSEIEQETGLYGRTVEECETIIKNLPENILQQWWKFVDWEGDIGKIRLKRITSCETECNGWDAFSRYQFIRIVQPTNVSATFEIPKIEGLFEPQLIVGWSEVDDYPSLDELYTLGVMLDKDEEDILIDELYLYSDKLAGWANWVQFPEYPNCPTCNQSMNQFVFQLASEDNIPYAWGDYGEGYIVQCPEHKEQVAFLWQC